VRHGLDAPRLQLAEPPLAADIGRGRPNGRDRPPLLAHRKSAHQVSTSDAHVAAQGLELRPAIAPLRRSQLTDADQRRATSRKDGNQVSEG